MRPTARALALAGMLASSAPGAVAQTGLPSGPFPAQAPTLHAGGVVTIPPDDPALSYTEYVNATIDSTRASFDRSIVNWTGNQHSPGTRVGFTSDATRIHVLVEYQGTFATPGSGLFRLEVDGQLAPRAVGSDQAFGIRRFELFAQPRPRPRRFSLVLPYASNVDLLGLELEGGSAGLLPSPPRPPFLYAAYGDSITHGFKATSVAAGYPYQVARLRGWRVTNMGFTGRKVTPADGFALGSVGADCVTVAIGVNDYLGEVTGPTPAATFRNRYDSFVSNLRILQPRVPVFAVTPTWIADEGVPNAIGLTVEDYRQIVREVVMQKALTDPLVFLVEGPSLVPAGLAFFPDGIHPNDAGFAAYASALSTILDASLGNDVAPASDEHR